MVRFIDLKKEDEFYTINIKDKKLERHKVIGNPYTDDLDGLGVLFIPINKEGDDIIVELSRSNHSVFLRNNNFIFISDKKVLEYL